MKFRVDCNRIEVNNQVLVKFISFIDLLYLLYLNFIYYSRVDVCVYICMYFS